MTVTSSDWIIQWSNSLVSLWSSHFLVASAPLQNWAGSDVNLSRLHLNSVTVMQSLVLQSEQSIGVSRGSQRSLKMEGQFSRLGEHQNWKTWKNSRVLRFDSSYIILFLDAFSLRQCVGQLQLDLVWVKQPFRDSRCREGGAEEGARSAPWLEVFGNMQSPSKLLRYPVTITPLLPFRGEKTRCHNCAMRLLRRCVSPLNDNMTSWILPNLRELMRAVRCDYPL